MSCKKTPESPGSPSSLIGHNFLFSGQSEAGDSNASGTRSVSRSVRVNAQGLFSNYSTLLSSQLAALGSPRMEVLQRLKTFIYIYTNFRFQRVLRFAIEDV